MTESFRISVTYSSVDELLKECKKKKYKSFQLSSEAKKLKDDLKLLPFYSIKENNVFMKKQRLIVAFEDEYVKYDISPKDERQYDPYIVISEFNSNGNKSKLFGLIQYIESFFIKEIEKFIKDEKLKVDNNEILPVIVRKETIDYIRMKMKFDSNGRLDNKIKDYSATPFEPFATKDGEYIDNDNCHEIKQGDRISGLVSTESVYCSRSGISLPLKVVSLEVTGAE